MLHGGYVSGLAGAIRPVDQILFAECARRRIDVPEAKMEPVVEVVLESDAAGEAEDHQEQPCGHTEYKMKCQQNLTHGYRMWSAMSPWPGRDEICYPSSAERSPRVLSAADRDA